MREILGNIRISPRSIQDVKFSIRIQAVFTLGKEICSIKRRKSMKYSKKLSKFVMEYETLQKNSKIYSQLQLQ